MNDLLAPTDSRLTGFTKELAARKSHFLSYLGDDETWKSFARSAVNCIAKKPSLLQCEAKSLWIALYNAAALGLEVDTPLRDATIVPRKGQAVFQAQYQGIINIALRSGDIREIHGDVVREGDEWEYERGFSSVLRHVPSGDLARPPKFYYAYFLGRQAGIRGAVVLSVGEVKRIRDRYSQAYQQAIKEGKSDTPWITEPDRMGVKTAIHALFDLMPRSVRKFTNLLKATETDNPVEASAQALRDLGVGGGDVPLEVGALAAGPAVEILDLQGIAERARAPQAASKAAAKAQVPVTTTGDPGPDKEPGRKIRPDGMVPYKEGVKPIWEFPVRTVSRTKSRRCGITGDEIYPGSRYFDAGGDRIASFEEGERLRKMTERGEKVVSPAEPDEDIEGTEGSGLAITMDEPEPPYDLPEIHDLGFSTDPALEEAAAEAEAQSVEIPPARYINSQEAYSIIHTAMTNNVSPRWLRHQIQTQPPFSAEPGKPSGLETFEECSFEHFNHLMHMALGGEPRMPEGWKP